MSRRVSGLIGVLVLVVLVPAAYGQPGNTPPAAGSSATARLVISCDRPNARVYLDGQPVFSGVGQVTRVVPAGRHEVTAMAPGHLADRRIVTLRPGQTERLAVGPLAMDAPVHERRRWRASVPWIVTGSGVALGLTALSLRWRSQANYDAYSQDIANLCRDMGCTKDQIPQSVLDLESRAKLQSRLSVVSFVAGGVTLTAGLVMVYMNKPRGVAITDRSAVQIAPPARGRGLVIAGMRRF